ncbi:hypothetical protein CBM2589_B170024 [Cupriavidus taiwanensis]|uniref:Uncharacterized protein n=1 Tax=Cupriavidus taiwanensis TaxID=164546 RepID=A0A375BKF2_9BURK|nr:hypothetical protein CBM2589_B170024 [Cupriavidus taiwanensis]
MPVAGAASCAALCRCLLPHTPADVASGNYCLPGPAKLSTVCAPASAPGWNAPCGYRASTARRR